MGSQRFCLVAMTDTDAQSHERESPLAAHLCPHWGPRGLFGDRKLGDHGVPAKADELSPLEV